MALIRTNKPAGSALPATLQFDCYGTNPLITFPKGFLDLYTTFTPTTGGNLMIDGTQTGSVTANTTYNIADYTFTSSIGIQGVGSNVSFSVTFA